MASAQTVVVVAARRATESFRDPRYQAFAVGGSVQAEDAAREVQFRLTRDKWTQGIHGAVRDASQQLVNAAIGAAAVGCALCALAVLRAP